ncbi:hypothetical protein MM213_19705 [Belliella sp. R4-6]|uniref:Uncharacterized protein n=1 Tax=Belliella alkalica TaxID=1730871 RepID=A0ABS9VH29_9BACT|nr:hypothetical protein [Belliella alkalica]MCH7415736.1 hypothetical protein [Belliella alkalica]
MKQRITLLMVMFFCMLVSSMEYFPNQDSESSHIKKETKTEQENSRQNQTFLDVAVDAVVPFVTSLGQISLYIIYEIIDFESVSISNTVNQVLLNLEFREILFERIISTNAP